MKEEELSHENIKQLLNRSVAQLERPTLTRLHHAREQALARYDACCGESVSARAGHVIWHAFDARHKSRWWATTLLVATILFSATVYWNQNAKSDTADVDIAILTGELPIHFYVD